MQNEVYIISLAPYAVASASRPFGTYLVPAAPKGGHIAYRVTDAIDWRMIGGDQKFPHAIQARALAEDLIKDVKDHGVFISDTEVPSPEDLADATARSLVYLRKQVEDADAEFRGHGDRGLISAHAKSAAERLGLKKEWLSLPLDLVACPNCGERVNPIAAQCTVCRATIDFERAREFALLTPEQERNAIAMGKLKPLFPDTETIPIPATPPSKVATKQARG